jgi:hypothetical protein
MTECKCNLYFEPLRRQERQEISNGYRYLSTLSLKFNIYGYVTTAGAGIKHFGSHGSIPDTPELELLAQDSVL